MEDMVIEHYGDPQIGPALRGLIGGETRYRTRKLFDLFYADLKSAGRDPYSIADRILIATDLPDIEPALLAPVLPRLDAASAIAGQISSGN